MTSMDGEMTMLVPSGNYFDFEHPYRYFDNLPLHVIISDIAWSLSRTTRFNGCEHGDEPLSVAQHCCLVSDLLPLELRLAGLLHDATEMLTGDLIRPVKHHTHDLRALESQIEPVVLGYFGLEYPQPAEVHHADRVALRIEQVAFMRNNDEWHLDVELPSLADTPWAGKESWDWRTARFNFLSRFIAHSPTAWLTDEVRALIGDRYGPVIRRA